jgi:hypothetical protein
LSVKVINANPLFSLLSLSSWTLPAIPITTQRHTLQLHPCNKLISHKK